jgi:hypothetical protein
MPFVTADAVSFEKRTGLTPTTEGSELCAEDGLRQDTHLATEKREV